MMPSLVQRRMGRRVASSSRCRISEGRWYYDCTRTRQRARKSCAICMDSCCLALNLDPVAATSFVTSPISQCSAYLRAPSRQVSMLGECTARRSMGFGSDRRRLGDAMYTQPLHLHHGFAMRHLAYKHLPAPFHIRMYAHSNDAHAMLQASPPNPTSLSRW
jgi:hypothetical protein